MNRLAIGYRKLNLQIRQVKELKKFNGSGFANNTRYLEQRKVLIKLLNPFVLMNTGKLPYTSDKHEVKYLNGLTKLASNDRAYNIQLNGFKS